MNLTKNGKKIIGEMILDTLSGKLKWKSVHYGEHQINWKTVVEFKKSSKTLEIIIYYYTKVVGISHVAIFLRDKGVTLHSWRIEQIDCDYKITNLVKLIERRNVSFN
jgi:hypothetical protein